MSDAPFWIRAVSVDGSEVLFGCVDTATGQVIDTAVAPAYWCVGCARPIDVCMRAHCVARDSVEPWKMLS
jgi:hypothetical protein